MQDIVPPNRNDKTKLEHTQDNLYSPSKYVGLKPRKELKPKGYSANENWEDDNLDNMLSKYRPKKRFNLFLIFAVVAFVFFIGAAFYGFFNFYGSGVRIGGEDVDINIIGPVAIGGGEELSLDIVLQNNNSIAIETVDLVIEYPEGTKMVDDLKTDLSRIRDGLGKIESGAILRKDYSATLFGEEGEDKQIIVSVEYRLPDSNAIFEKKKVFDITLKSSPIRLIVDTVKEINEGQELVFDVLLSSNSNQILQNIMLEVSYPFGFQIESFTRNPYVSNNKWFFDVLRPKETQKFQIKGKLIGQDKEERVFKFKTGVRDEKNTEDLGIIFTTLPKSITISKPFFETRLSLDGVSDSEIVKQGDQIIRADLRYKNNTDVNISNAEIILRFNGDVLDKESVRVTDGFYRSSDNTIIWNKSTNNRLDEIKAGQSGTLSFTFRTKPLASGSVVFKNPEITISIDSSGLRISEEEVQETIRSTSFNKIKFISGLDLLASSRRDSNDIGPIPPKVDQETSYTIDLELKNTSNELSGGVVNVHLPTYVKWNNVISSDGQLVNYDPISRVVEWKVGDVATFVGYTLPSRKISFQVSLTPSASQIGNSPVLVDNIRFSALDLFVDRTIETITENVTTEIYGSFDRSTSQVTD